MAFLIPKKSWYNVLVKLIIGLGNPGEKYQGTRHNLGFEVLEKFVSSRKYQQAWAENKKFRSQIIKVDDQLILAKPLSYMNNSGMAVAALASFYKIAPGDIVIVHDELDLPLGSIKVRLGGAGAGHHGVESVIEKLGNDKFVRIRLGIGNWKTQSSEHGGNHLSVESYVLSPFKPAEKSGVKQLIKKGVRAVEVILEKGLESAQNQFN